MSPKKRSRTSSWWAYVLALLFISLALLLWMQRTYLQDQLLVWQYEPTEEIAAISDRITLAPKGEFYFYASSPTVNEAQLFNQFCARREPSSAVLGCYTNRQIFLFQIDNEELDGIIEVTAAHEMLHAAWDRMSEATKSTLAEQLEAVYEDNRTSKLQERMEYYERTQPGEHVNELHSIIGTEFGTLPAELEEHYSQFFEDRSRVVALHDQYQRVFLEIEERVQVLGEEIDGRSAEINRDIDRYNQESAALRSAIESLNQRATSLDTTDAAAVVAYNTDRAALLAEISRLENERQALNTSIATYNRILDEYNDTVIRSNQLTQSIDSLAPVPGIQ